MTDAQKPYVLDNFQTAVADSPYFGHSLMRNVDIETSFGALKAAKGWFNIVQTVNGSLTFTAVAATDICTASGNLHPQALIDRGQSYQSAAVTFTTSGTLPAGLALNTVYFLIFIGNTTFKVATTRANADAGTAINITDTGSGTHTIVPVPVGTFNHVRKDYRTNYMFAQDSNGRVWVNLNNLEFVLLAGNTITNASGNGISLFRTSDGLKTFLFVFRNGVIDVIEVTGTSQIDSPSWTTSWQSMNTAIGINNTHAPLVGQDNIIYFPDSRFVGSILEKAGQVFDPSSSATYTYNNQALDTPQDEILSCLEELGTNLLAGGLTYNKIYPWDRTSASYTLPLLAPEVGIYKMKNAGNIVYILAGVKGNIYKTPGTYVSLFKAIPGYIKNNLNVLTSSPVIWGGIAIKTGALIVGLTGQVTGNSGVYMVYDDGRILQDATPYEGSMQVQSLFSDSDYYFMGYAGGIGYPKTVSLPAAGTFNAVYQGPLKRVGNKTEKAGYSQLEVQLGKPAATGQIRVSWRANDSSSFTVLDTYFCDGATTSFQTDIGLIDLENVQVQVEYDSDVEIISTALNP